MTRAQAQLEMIARKANVAMVAVDSLRSQVDNLKLAIRHCSIRCEHLHHDPDQQHASDAECPVEKWITSLML